MENMIAEAILSVGGAIIVLWLRQLSNKVNDIDKRLRAAPSRDEVREEIKIQQESIKVLQQEIKEDVKELRADIKRLLEIK